MRALLFYVLPAVLACTPERPAGTCLFWDDCGAGGACEYAGGSPLTCSFADDSCPSGRRFGAYAPDDRADRCVDHAPTFGGLCDEQHPCDVAHRCMLGRCINVASVATGEEIVATTCVADAAFWLWGVPFQLTGMPGAIAPGAWSAPIVADDIAIGVEHLCVVTRGGVSECFCPTNDPILLGSGAPGDPGFVIAPGGPYDDLSASAGHTCGRRGPEVHCWGRNASAQLDGSPGPDSATPRATSFSAPVLHVAAGRTFTCGSAASSEVRCWGGASNWVAGTLVGNVVQGLPPGEITALDAGERHACAIADGAVACWGQNDAGQASGAASTIPVAVERVAVGEAISVATGADHSCAVTVDHEVWCWGSGARGQLGGAPGPAPARIALPARAIGPIDAGDGFSCALLEDSLVHCWGDDQVVRPQGLPLERVLTCTP